MKNCVKERNDLTANRFSALEKAIALSLSVLCMLSFFSCSKPVAQPMAYSEAEAIEISKKYVKSPDFTARASKIYAFFCWKSGPYCTECYLFGDVYGCVLEGAIWYTESSDPSTSGERSIHYDFVVIVNVNKYTGACKSTP